MVKMVTILMALDLAWRIGLFLTCLYFMKDLMAVYVVKPIRKYVRLSVALLLLSDLAQISMIFRPEKSQIIKYFTEMIFNFSLLSVILLLILNIKQNARHAR